jgi:hypothetical protein
MTLASGRGTVSPRIPPEIALPKRGSAPDSPPECRWPECWNRLETPLEAEIASSLKIEAQSPGSCAPAEAVLCRRRQRPCQQQGRHAQPSSPGLRCRVSWIAAHSLRALRVRVGKATGQWSDLVRVAEQVVRSMLGYEAKLAVAWGAQWPGRGNNGGGSMQRLSRRIV